MRVYHPSPYAGAPLEILPSEERDGSFPARGRIRFRNPHPKRGPSCPRPRQALWTLRALACRYRLGAQAQPLLLPDTINLPSKLATQRGGSRMRTNTIRMGLLACFAAAVAFGGSEALADQNASCGISVGTVNAIQAQLGHVINSPDGNGGLFKPNRMWSAIVDRTGKLCSVITSYPTHGQAVARSPSPRLVRLMTSATISWRYQLPIFMDRHSQVAHFMVSIIPIHSIRSSCHKTQVLGMLWVELLPLVAE